MTIEQRIINVAEKQNYYDSRELRAIALEVRKREDRIKQLEEMYEGVIGEKPELLGSNVMGLLKRELNFAQNRIKQLEEELMDVKNKHSVLVADVALYEDRADRIHRLEDRIHRAAMAFFRDGSDGHVASQMLQILEEERGKK